MATIAYSAELRRRLISGETPTWIALNNRREYWIALILSCPDWADREAIRAIQRDARRKTQLSGRQYVVDHVIPLTHRLVCGLTVPNNLRVIRATENAARSNRWWEWTDDMFNEPEQLRLI